MTVCKFFLQGTCKFGSSCRFDHSVNAGNAGAPASAVAADVNTLIRSVQTDMTNAENGGQWLLSCYAPFKEKPVFPGFEETSFEEVRLGYYEALKSGSVEAFKQQLQGLLQSTVMKVRALQNPGADLVNILKDLYNMPGTYCGNNNRSFASTGAGSSNPFGAAQQKGAFGGPTTAQSTNGPFRFQGSNPFGGGAKAQGQAGPFGGNASQYAAQQPFAGNSPFGAAPQVSNSPFGAAPNSSPFGGAPAASPFGVAQAPFGAATANNSPFGAQQPVAAGSTNPFGGQQPVATSNTSPFGAQQPIATSPFGVQKPVAASNTSPFGAQQPVATNNSSPFGAQQPAATSNSVFAVQQSNSPFGGSNNTSPFGGGQQPMNNNPFGGGGGQGFSGQRPLGNPPGYAMPQAAEPKVAAGPFGGDSPFGGAPQPSQSSIFGGQQQQPPPPNAGEAHLHSRKEDLTEAELAAFQSPSFEFGKIPEHPPPSEMCI